METEKLENVNPKLTLEYWQSQLGEQFTEALKINHKGKDIPAAISEAFMYLLADEQRILNSDASDFKRLVNAWLSNKRPTKQPKRFKL